MKKLRDMLFKAKSGDTDAKPRKRVVPLWRRPAALFAVGLIVVSAVAGAGTWVWTSGLMRMAWQNVVSETVALAAGQGLTVQEVLVLGRRETDRETLLDTLGVARGEPILAFDFDAAQSRLQALPWVLVAQVERKLPDTIIVHMTERRPLALWQNQGRFALIDDEGEVIIRSGLERFGGLIQIVGSDAPANVGGLIELLQTQPLISERVEAAVRVGGRRWDLRLKGGVDVKLPEQNALEALERLAAFERENAILGRDVQVLDLRVPDRVIVRRVSSPPKRPAATADQNT